MKGARDVKPRKRRGMKASRLAEVATGMKLCKRCGEVKALDDFPLVTNRSRRDHLKTWMYPRPECSACLAASKAHRFQNRKEIYRVARERAYANDPVKARWWASITRARKRGATALLSLDEWRRICAEPNCHWCGMELHASFRNIDHVTPLSRGGQHSADNLVASCANCNQRRAWESRTKYRPNANNEVICG